MNTCLVHTILVWFDAVSFSGSNKLLGLLLFSYLTKQTCKEHHHTTFPSTISNQTTHNSIYFNEYHPDFHHLQLHQCTITPSIDLAYLFYTTTSFPSTISNQPHANPYILMNTFVISTVYLSINAPPIDLAYWFIVVSILHQSTQQNHHHKFPIHQLDHVLHKTQVDRK